MSYEINYNFEVFEDLKTLTLMLETFEKLKLINLQYDEKLLKVEKINKS